MSLLTTDSRSSSDQNRATAALQAEITNLRKMLETAASSMLNMSHTISSQYEELSLWRQGAMPQRVANGGTVAPPSSQLKIVR